MLCVALLPMLLAPRAAAAGFDEGASQERGSQSGTEALAMRGAPARRAAEHEAASRFDSSEGEEEQDDEEAEGEEGDEEEEEITDIDIGLGWMLLGSVGFIMVLFYLVNYKDDDIRKYSWSIISTTVSIFTAVLCYTGVNEVLDEILKKYGLLGKMSNPFITVNVHYALLCAWLSMLHFMVWFHSGGWHPASAEEWEKRNWVIADPLRSDYGTPLEKVLQEISIALDVPPPAPMENQLAILDLNDEKKNTKGIIYRFGHPVFVRLVPTTKLESERKTKCWATLSAHMTGFAAIGAGGHLQHVPIFSSSWVMSLVAVGLNTLMLVVLMYGIKLVRESKLSGFRKVEIVESQHESTELVGHEAAHNKHNHGLEELREEETEEAENDVLALAVSFLLVQSIKFALTGVLSNVEGLESETLHPPTGIVVALYLIGVGSAIVAIALMTVGIESRVLEVTQNIFGMAFAWCFMWATRWVAMDLTVFKQQHMEPHTMVGKLVITMFLSCAALIIIFFLDVLEDSQMDLWDDFYDGEALTKAMRHMSRMIQIIITALSILVGFSWEHVFDGGVEAVVDKTENPLTIKCILTFMVTIVIVPAWRMYILTKVEYLKSMEGEVKSTKTGLKKLKDLQRSGMETAATTAGSNEREPDRTGTGSKEKAAMISKEQANAWLNHLMQQKVALERQIEIVKKQV